MSTTQLESPPIRCVLLDHDLERHLRVEEEVNTRAAHPPVRSEVCAFRVIEVVLDDSGFADVDADGPVVADGDVRDAMVLFEALLNEFAVEKMELLPTA